MARSTQESGNPRPIPAPPVFPDRPDARRRATLRRRLLAWYAKTRRDLPWRRSREAYGIWISEAMLQQTRVETVVGYWSRFLEAFPTPRSLAEADEDDVLAAWSGLGYYRRARALKAAAEAIVERHGGELPADLDALRALPGVGPYTAGAVASIAFGLPVPLVDGNVARVFCRLFGLDAPAESGALQRELWARAGELVPRAGAGDWNQALMELGATCCSPRDPDCDRCPLARTCVARAEDLVGVLPRPKLRPEPIDVSLDVHWIESRGRLLLERRPKGGRMGGMWQCPTVEAAIPGRSEPRLFPDSLPRSPQGKPFAVPGEPWAELKHSITRHRIRARVLKSSLRGTSIPSNWAWHDVEDLGKLPLTGMTKKVISKAPSTRNA